MVLHSQRPLFNMKCNTCSLSLRWCNEPARVVIRVLIIDFNSKKMSQLSSERNKNINGSFLTSNLAHAQKSSFASMDQSKLQPLGTKSWWRGEKIGQTCYCTFPWKWLLCLIFRRRCFDRRCRSFFFWCWRTLRCVDSVFNFLSKKTFFAGLMLLLSIERRQSLKSNFFKVKILAQNWGKNKTLLIFLLLNFLTWKISWQMDRK